MRSRTVAAACLSIVCTTAAASAQQRGGPADAAHPPATITERTYIGGGLMPSRTIQRRTESAGRQVVVDTEERLGADGRWERVEESVTETLRTGVAVQTRRQVFGFDVERRRTLLETTETQETLDRDIVRVVEETRIPDINGGSGLTSRWIEERRTAGPDELQIVATLFRRTINGSLRETERTTHIERQVEPAVTSVESTYRVRDINGRWIPIEARTTEIRDTPAERIEEETIRRADVNGSVAVIERIVTRRSEANGRELLVVDRYAPNAEGFFRSGGHLALSERFRRSTIVSADGGRSVIEEVEARSRVSPADPMRVVRRSVATVMNAAPELRVTERRFFELDVNGRLAPVSVDIEEVVGR